MDINNSEIQTNIESKSKKPKLLKYLAASSLLSWIMALTIFSISISAHARTKN